MRSQTLVVCLLLALVSSFGLEPEIKTVGGRYTMAYNLGFPDFAGSCITDEMR